LVNVLGQPIEIEPGDRPDGRIIGDETIAFGGDYDLRARNVVLWSSYDAMDE
jgi:hypothetical protein